MLPVARTDRQTGREREIERERVTQADRQTNKDTDTDTHRMHFLEEPVEVPHEIPLLVQR